MGEITAEMIEAAARVIAVIEEASQAKWPKYEGHARLALQAAGRVQEIGPEPAAREALRTPVA